jgi:ERCC4-type nuclease
MLVVTADVREESSEVPFLLETFGVRVERRRLRFGDYVCGPETVVERKTALDLHKTLSAGRLWPQLGRLRDAGRSPYLIVEGRRLFQGPINADGIRGACLAASDLGIAVLLTEDVYDTARWIYHLTLRRQEGATRDRPAYAQRPKRQRHIAPAEQALAAAPGVSTAAARALLGHFGSLKRIVLADPTEWQEAPGIGPIRASALTSMIHDEWAATPHRPR